MLWGYLIFLSSHQKVQKYESMIATLHNFHYQYHSMIISLVQCTSFALSCQELETRLRALQN